MGMIRGLQGLGLWWATLKFSCGGDQRLTIQNFVSEQEFVWSLMRNCIMGINHLSLRNVGTRFSKRARRGDRLYGVAHLSRGAGPLRVTEERIKSKDKNKENDNNNK